MNIWEVSLGLQRILNKINHAILSFDFFLLGPYSFAFDNRDASPQLNISASPSPRL